MFGRNTPDRNTKSTPSRRDELAKRYEQGGWRRTAPKDSPAGRNRDAKKGL